MKNIIFSSLLLLTFTSVQAASAKDFRSISGSILSMKDPNAPSGDQMSDDEMKTLFKDAKEEYVKKIIITYEKEIIEGLETAKDKDEYIRSHSGNKTEKFIRCLLTATAKHNPSWKAPILQKHLFYYIKALANVTNAPHKFEEMGKQYKDSYKASLAIVKQELKGTSPEQKESNKAWRKKCEVVLKQATDINKAAAPSNPLLLLDFE